MTHVSYQNRNRSSISYTSVALIEFIAHWFRNQKIKRWLNVITWQHMYLDVLLSYSYCFLGHSLHWNGKDQWQRQKGLPSNSWIKSLPKQKNLQISFGCGNYNYIQIIQPTSRLQAWKSLLTLNKYADIIHILQQEFSSRFQHFRKLGWFQLFHVTF